MKNKKTFIIILISLLILLSLTEYAIIKKYVIINLPNNINFYDALSSFSTALTTFVSFANLFIIIHFFIKDKKLRKAENVNNSKAEWFTELILKQNIDNINIFFKKCDSIVSECIKATKEGNASIGSYGEEIKKQIGFFSKERADFSTNFIDLTAIFGTTLNSNLLKYLDDYEEEFTVKLSSMSGINTKICDECRELITKYKIKFYEELYNYQLNIYRENNFNK